MLRALSLTMAGHEHEALVRLFRDHPFLVTTVLSQWLGETALSSALCSVVDSDLSETAPVELRADAVFLVCEPSGAAIRAVVLEVQREWDDDKQWSWPAYVALARVRHRCPTVLLAITLDDATAQRAQRPISIDDAQHWRPLVLGPRAIPRIEEPEEMRRQPTLGLLSALAHSYALEDFPVVQAALMGLPGSSLDGELLEYYFRVMDAAFGPALRAALEASMEHGQDIPPGPIGQFFLKKGREEGRAEGIASALLTVLQSRQVSLTKEQRERIEHCDDRALLDLWIRRAATATSAQELFRAD